jgi:GNAT superfamily N-acetyltransferase
MSIRAAKNEDIPAMQKIRNSVLENVLSNPDLVKDDDYAQMILHKGKIWVYEMDSVVLGFACVDLSENNVWALFVNPNFEKQGIGRSLHNCMLKWYFEQTQKTIWLSTEANSRAYGFYKKAGWRERGSYGKIEIKFEMSFDDWKRSINEL